ncbi:unnamed protein product [Rotaria sordida]|uniref:Uncharacterized protein n=2 Tax=Rotaria sordida TaxID=392033 RepID=A0A815C9L2_9BILA|nr:unnamed protein product [Rotaria sordida]CAF1280490.1 unnamed protein product [Rotaria sordida]CAF3541325.1 unnamed protein product [Rotaria sordida]CAF3695712.1 unnamed protein product [Rotaria sordida]
MAHRKLAKFFSKGSIPSNKKEEHVIPQTMDQTEALIDLYSTYVHPIKSSYQTNSKKLHQKKNSISVLKQRETGQINFHRYPNARYNLMDRLLPNEGEVIASMTRPAFCGQFSEDGQRFFSACQDYCIRLYDTTSRMFHQQAEIVAEEVGWSILDTALSPDRNSIAYGTWSDCLYLIKLNENQSQSNIIPLHLEPHSHSFSIFSLQYSADGSEIIGGSNDTCVYIYDLHRQKRTLRVQAHEDDVNAVRFIDNSNSLIVSGSDDNFVSIWDRRALNESQPKPVGIFAGHTNGITFVHSRMDTRYLISNSKDQSIKLWDMRHFANESVIDKIRTKSNSSDYGWDYRYDGYRPQPQSYDIPGDPSIRTYRGHSVRYTLIRCYFSPSFTTGQKYIITGSSDGCIHIYDILTGTIELRLRISNHMNESRERCVRDISWHPYENYIISTSWDSRRAHVRWTYSFDKAIDSKSSCSSESKVVSCESINSTTIQHPTALLRRLLNRQFLGYYLDQSSSEDSSP